MKRRTLLQLLVGVGTALPMRLGLRAQTTALSTADRARLVALAEAVLPAEIGTARRDAVVDDFLRWHREYRAGAATDYGYGFPRLRRLPPAPGAKYRAQLDALDERAKSTGQAFSQLAVNARRPIVEAAITAAGIERLPGRPDGGHIATDLMGFYFNSSEASDLCYERAIGADTCRGLEGSGERPRSL
jgi:hypothetical protein